MQTEETPVETTDVSKIEGLLNKFTDAIKNVVEGYSNKPEEVKILDHTEVAGLLDTLKNDLQTAKDKEAEVSGLKAEIDSLKTDLAKAKAGETEINNVVEPEIEPVDPKKEAPKTEWDKTAELVRNRGWVGKV